MQIHEPQIVEHGGRTVVRAAVESAAGNETLWYSLSTKYRELLVDSCDGFLVALLIPAMANAENIYIAGSISARLWHNLSGPYQRLLQHMIPGLNRVTIYPAELVMERPSGSGVITGFSGGIDSYCTLADHYYSDVPSAFKITHLLFNNVGSHGRKEQGERLFRERYLAAELIALRIGLPLVVINSNLDAFYKESLGFRLTHTARNASVGLLLQGGIARYMYSSTFSFDSVHIGPTYNMAFTDPIVLPFFCTEGFDALSVGSEYTRVEKTLRVAELPVSYHTLDVCVGRDKAGNCSRCSKCMRTLLTLDIAGCLERYSPVFDLDVYRGQKNAYIAQILRSSNPLLREIVQFARSRQYGWPVSSYVHACIPKWTRCIARTVLRGHRRLRGAF